MEWQKLDIRKASVLKKQVDLGLQALKTALHEGDGVRRAALIQSFLVQIDEIEEFRSMNDSDERSILFERERLRLRKAVQENSAQSSVVNNSTTQSNSSSPVMKSIAQRNTEENNKSKMSVAFDGDGSPASPNKNSKGAMGKTGMGKTPSNIYAWENGDVKKIRRRPIAIEGTVFAPAEADGVYVKDDENVQDELGAGESKTGAGGDKYIDMYFILTAEEVSTLASRLQHNKSHDKRVFKSQTSSSGVQHSTPYVDNARIENMLYRETHKEKWTDDKDMRPNAK